MKFNYDESLYIYERDENERGGDCCRLCASAPHYKLLYVNGFNNVLVDRGII